MKLLLELSMECETLARSEALSAATALGGEPQVLHSEPGVVIIDTEADPRALAERLGLCHHVSEFLGSCRFEDVEAEASGLEVVGPVRVRSTKVGEITLDLQGMTRKVGAVLGRSGGVDLHSPKTDIRVVYSSKAHIGRLLASVDRASFEKRKNRYMPYVYPASLHPKFARALVNLTQVRGHERLLDPFCGTGAIAAEAALVGLDAVGTDFSQKMIEGSGRNLAHLGLRAKLQTCDVGDILSTVGKVSGIATDPPYGRSTSTDGESIPDLMKRSFDAFSEVLERPRRFCVVVPDINLLKSADAFQMVESHRLWVHRSLTRYFCVLERS